MRTISQPPTRTPRSRVHASPLSIWGTPGGGASGAAHLSKSTPDPADGDASPAGGYFDPQNVLCSTCGEGYDCDGVCFGPTKDLLLLVGSPIATA